MILTKLELQYPLFGHFTYFLKDFSAYLGLIILSFILLITSIRKIHKKEISEHRKRILIACIFTVFILILMYSLFEAYFRYYYDVTDGLGFLKITRKWEQRHVSLNNEFVRDRNFVENKTEGVTRIGVIGDSIAYGGGVEDVNKRFSNLLEKKLKAVGKNIEVYNMGRPGYDTDTEISIYDGIKHYNFDIIVWEYFINDAQPGTQSTGTPIIENGRKRNAIINLLSDRSYFFDFMYWRLSSKYKKIFHDLRTADIAQYSNESVMKQHKEDIKTLLAKIKERNSKLIVIMFPSNVLLGPNYPKYVHEMMGGYFRENGVEFYDLLDDLKDRDGKTLIASKFDPHPNEIVHEIAAEKLYNLILPQVK